MLMHDAATQKRQPRDGWRLGVEESSHRHDSCWCLVAVPVAPHPVALAASGTRLCSTLERHLFSTYLQFGAFRYRLGLLQLYRAVSCPFCFLLFRIILSVA